MALVLADRVKETSTTAGQGTITLAGAVTGFQSFSVIGDGNTTYYTIAGQGTSEWEVGIGTYTASGTTLSRDTVLASSAGAPTKTNFGVGTKDVFVTYPAGKSVYEDANNDVALPANLSVDGNTTLGNASGDSVTFNASTASTPNGLNFDSNTLVIDATNDRVGVGTNAPRTGLEVYSAAADATITLERGSTTITTSDVYGGIDFYGNDSSANANGVRARIRGVSLGTTGAAKIAFSVANASSTTLNERFSISGSSIISQGTFSHTGPMLVDGKFNQLNSWLSGTLVQSNVDTQTDIDISAAVTTIYTLAGAYLMFDVVGNYWADFTGTAATARLNKSWTQNNHYNGTAIVTAGAVLKWTVYNSDATNFPAGAVNASKVLTAISGSTLYLRLQNRTSPAAASGTDWVYSVQYLNYWNS
jgi:hypothetical protein